MVVGHHSTGWGHRRLSFRTSGPPQNHRLLLRAEHECGARAELRAKASGPDQCNGRHGPFMPTTASLRVPPGQHGLSAHLGPTRIAEHRHGSVFDQTGPSRFCCLRSLWIAPRFPSSRGCRLAVTLSCANGNRSCKGQRAGVRNPRRGLLLHDHVHLRGCDRRGAEGVCLRCEGCRFGLMESAPPRAMTCRSDGVAK